MSVSNSTVCQMQVFRVVIVNRKEGTVIADKIVIAINEAGAIVKAYKANADAVKGKYAAYFANHIGCYETAVGKVSAGKAEARSAR